MASPYDPQPLYDRSPSSISSPSAFTPSRIPTPCMNIDATENPSPTSVGQRREHADRALYAEKLESACFNREPNKARSQQSICQTRIEHKMHCSVSLASRSSNPDTKTKINTPFSLLTMHKMFMKFGHEKRALMDSIGLGGLLKVHKQRLQCRNLIAHLLSNMDPISGTITLKSSELEVKDRDVNLVLGIPWKGEAVNPCSACPSLLNKAKAILLLDSDTDITTETVDAVLLREYGRKMNAHERDAFKVAAMLFVDSCFLGPRGSRRKINKDILKYVVDPVHITKMNWSGYVLSVLRESASKVQHNLKAANKSVLVEGCILFLLVFYLDNLNFGYMTPRHDILPRIAKYTPALVSELIAYDQRTTLTHKGTQHGRCKLRCKEDVIYSRSQVSAEGKPSMRVNQFCAQISNATFTTHGSFVSSEHDAAKSKVDEQLNIFGTEDLVEEYFNVFTSQIYEATDELRRKLCILIKNSYGHPSHTSQLLKDSNDPSKDHSSQCTPTTSKLGFKARSGSFSSFTNPDLLSGIANIVSEKLTLAAESNFQDECIPSAPSTTESLPHDFPQTEHESVFGPSPFELFLSHKEIPFKCIMAVIKVLSNLTEDDRKLTWYINDMPRKLQIVGESLYQTFYNDSDFTFDIMNAVLRLYEQLDDQMYQGYHRTTWRHFLPADWASIALAGNKLVGNSMVKDMFIGDHISHEVASCRIVAAPVYTESHWSLYTWDFASRTITVLDPVATSTDIIPEKHNHAISCLHKAIITCKEVFLNQRVCNISKWHQKYLPPKDNHASMGKSGLYTAFYARFFDGQACTRSMVVEDSVVLFQTSLLCQLLSSPGNKGTYPQAIQIALSQEN